MPRKRVRNDAPDPAVERPVPELAADLIGWLVTSLSMRMSRSASSYYQQHWNIGTTEYRLILALGIEHGCTAVRVATAADVDKAAASRSLQVLQKDGLVELIKHGREMKVLLTSAGESLYRQLQAGTLRREARITRGMSATQVKRLRAGIPMKRGGEPEEVARAILWLLSDEASYSTGAILDVTGGR